MPGSQSVCEDWMGQACKECSSKAQGERSQWDPQGRHRGSTMGAQSPRLAGNWQGRVCPLVPASKASLVPSPPSLSQA